MFYVRNKFSSILIYVVTIFQKRQVGKIHFSMLLLENYKLPYELDEK